MGFAVAVRRPLTVFVLVVGVIFWPVRAAAATFSAVTSTVVAAGPTPRMRAGRRGPARRVIEVASMTALNEAIIGYEPSTYLRPSGPCRASAGGPDSTAGLHAVADLHFEHEGPIYDARAPVPAAEAVDATAAAGLQAQLAAQVDPSVVREDSRGGRS